MAMIRNTRFYLLLTLFLSIMACTGPLFKNYGRIDPSREATRAFESYQVSPEFRYYISGSSGIPTP